MQCKGRIFVKIMLVVCWLAGPLTIRAVEGFCEDPWPPIGQDDAWVNNQIAVDHTVPPPWTPVNVEGSCIHVWGRETDFEGKALPAQIITQQTPLLVDRVGLLVQTNEMQTLTPMAEGYGEIVETHPDKVVWQGLTQAGGVAVETAVTIEFDGFTWLTLRIQPNATALLKRLVLEFPIREDTARFYHKKMEEYSPAAIKDMWGRVEGRSLTLQDFSLVNEDSGLSFFAEGRTGWMQDRTDRQVEWIVEDGQVKVRFNLIDLFVPRVIKDERIISLGWNPMPVKPMREDWRRYFVFGCGDAPDSYKRWGETGMTPIFIRLAYHQPETPENLNQWCAEAASSDGLAYCPWSGNPKPYNIAGFNQYAARLREVCPGSKVTIYTVGTEHTALDPVVFEHQEEWSQTATRFTAEDIAEGKTVSEECPCRLFICGRSSFPDYKVWFMDDLFKKLDIDGYYYDNQIFRSCQNPAHVDHLIPDEIYPLLATREMYKRIYKALRKEKPDTVIVGHEAAAAYPFVDFAIGLEALLRLTGEESFYTSVMTSDDCRGSFFRGHQRGIPFLWLPEYRGQLMSGLESIRSTRAMLSLLWLCDTQYWVAWSNQDILHRDLNIRGHFKIWEAQCLPFWRQEVASSDQEDVKIAVYRKPQVSLLFVSNPGENAYPNVTISINTSDGLFEPGIDLQNLDIRDAETGHALAGQGRESEGKTFCDVSVAIPDQDYRIIIIGTPEAVKEALHTKSISAGDGILVDFSDHFAGTLDGAGRHWNKGLNHGIYRIATPGIIQNLKNTAGTFTQVGFRTPNWFETSNAMGLATSALSNYPDFATKDSVFLDPRYDPTAQCVFDGLDTNLTYNLTFYGSRGVTADPRVLQVTIDGVSQSYDAGGSAGEGLVTFTGISPNESGEIVIDFSTPNLGYLGVIELAAIDMTQTPVLSPDGGPITASQIVTITCDTPGAEIHYTLNGEPPTLQSPLYTSPIEVNPGQTLSARAWAPGYSPSRVKSAVYTAVPELAGYRILMDFSDHFTGTTDGSGWVWNKGLNHGIYRIATPGIIQNLKNTAGTFTQVGFRTPNWFETSNAMGLATSALSNYPDFATKDSVFLDPRYDPTAQCVFDGLDTNLTYNLTFYGSRGVTADPRVLQVTIDGVSQSYDAGGSAGEGLVTFTGISPNESGEIVIDFSTPNLGYLGVIELAAIDMTQTPVLSPDGGPITASQIVTITCDTPGAEIHYTLNGEPPTLQSPLYTSPIEVNPGQTLSARAWAPGYSPSRVKSAVYTACTNPVYIYRGDGSVRVDGDLSEWLENEFIPLTNNYYGEPQVRNAAYAVRWDAATNQFYVAVKVYDPVHVFVDMYDNWDAQDGVEVYVHTTGGLPYE